jgi:cytosol aminopeptidase
MHRRMRTLQVGQNFERFTIISKLKNLITAVAAHLARYKFTLKTSPPSPYKPGGENAVPQELSFQPLQDSPEWETGSIYAEAQNLARTVPAISS